MLKWERGRQLAKYGEIEYRYDASGIRQEKQVGNVLHKYYTDGSRIYKEERGNEVLWYHYDNTGVTGLEHNGKKYYFQKNIQGDVVRIFDEAGSLKASYIYDAWGNHRVIDGMTGMDVTHDFTIGGVTTDVSQHIGNINPFRYRGYYFDRETGLYYLNSRYYDPAICRFINADDVAYLQPETLNGNNLYAYCGNNPVMYSDGSGCSPLPWWGKLLIGIGIIAVLAVATIATAGIAGVGVGTAFAAGFSGSAIGIGASGAAVTIASGAFAGAVVGAGIGFVGGAIGGAISTGTWMGVLDGASSGFMWGSITGAITGGIRSGINYARTTPLIRSVSAKELSSVKTTKVFSSNGAMESKWFATNKLNASKWGNWFGQTDYVGIRVLKSSLKNGYYNPILDGIGAAYCFDIDLLNTIIRGMVLLEEFRRK